MTGFGAYGDEPDGVPTVGGASVVLNGAGFGPVPSLISVMWDGRVVEGVVLSVPHTRVSFPSPPGAGPPVTITLTVAGQTVATLNGTTRPLTLRYVRGRCLPLALSPVGVHMCQRLPTSVSRVLLSVGTCTHAYAQPPAVLLLGSSLAHVPFHLLVHRLQRPHTTTTTTSPSPLYVPLLPPVPFLWSVPPVPRSCVGMAQTLYVPPVPPVPRSCVGMARPV